MKIWLKFGLVMLLVLAAAEMGYADFATIAVSPVTKSIVLSKGETQSGTYVVYNNSDEAQHVSVVPRYWQMVEENKKIPLASWLTIAPTELDLEPREKKQVTFDIKVPEEAIGELAVMIAFRPKRREAQAVNVVFSVSLYVRIKDAENIGYKISDFKLWKFEERNALGANIVFKNTGSVHLKPKTEVYIQDLFNKNLQKAPLRYGKPVYPGKAQSYDGAIYDFKLKPGLYKAHVYTEFTNVSERFVKKIYFLVGRNGKVLLTFFRPPAK